MNFRASLIEDDDTEFRIHGQVFVGEPARERFAVLDRL
jgi:hypothetical protein